MAYSIRFDAPGNPYEHSHTFLCNLELCCHLIAIHSALMCFNYDGKSVIELAFEIKHF